MAYDTSITAKLVASRSGMYDAFGRLRTSHAYTLFDCKHLYDAQALWWDDQGTGAGTSSTFIANQSLMRLSVATSPQVPARGRPSAA